MSNHGKKTPTCDLKWYNPVLELMSDKWLSTKEIRDAVDYHPRGANSLTRTMERMLEERIIERKELTGRPGHHGYFWRLRIK